MQLLERHTSGAEAPVSGRVFSQPQPTWGPPATVCAARLAPSLPILGRGGARLLFPRAGAAPRFPLPEAPARTSRGLLLLCQLRQLAGTWSDPARRPSALGPPQLRALRVRRLSNARVPRELSEPPPQHPPTPRLNPGRCCGVSHAPQESSGPACHPGAVLLNAQPRAPTVGSCVHSACRAPVGRRGSRAERRTPSPCVPRRGRAPAHTPPPTVPPFSPQVLKLSLRGDTAAAAALLPLLCIPMDMHCKADPFSAMHREYRRPATGPARDSSSSPRALPLATRDPALRFHRGGYAASLLRSPFFLLPSILQSPLSLSLPPVTRFYLALYFPC